MKLYEVIVRHYPDDLVKLRKVHKIPSDPDKPNYVQDKDVMKWINQYSRIGPPTTPRKRRWP